ncbi:MAG TPA: arginyltransferase [Chromatiaceae bacterium]|nr:arginyltransferase [Chromatiaceae bacterium]
MRLNLGLTQEHPCSYLEGRMARSLMVIDEELLSPQTYDVLLLNGYRRSGDHAYRPWCENCKECHAVRVPVECYRPNRSQRRCWNANQDLQLDWRPAELTDEQYQLYLSYQAHRHTGGAMAESSFDETREFLLASWNDVRFLEMRLGDELLAVAVTDFQPRSLSAVYTFFRPDMNRRSLGSYAILQQINHARELGKSWLYLGYWIPGSRKMAYKAAFRPIEVRAPTDDMQNEQWMEQC